MAPAGAPGRPKLGGVCDEVTLLPQAFRGRSTEEPTTERPTTERPTAERPTAERPTGEST